MPGPQAQYRAIHIIGTTLLPGLLLVLLVLAAFGPALWHDFAWDDHGLIVQNPDIRVTSSWARPFLRSFWQTGANVEDATRSFYRPIVSLSYRIDYAIWSLNPMGFHATNILLHALVTLLVFGLGLRLLDNRAAALVAAALFAIHPSHVENIVWISGRTDILCSLFALAALLLLLPTRKGVPPSVGRAAAGCGLCFLALLGKEMALSLPILLAAYIVLLPPEHRRAYLLLLAGLFATTGLYMLLRVSVLGRIVGPALFGTPAERIAAIPAVFSHYIGVLVHWIPIDPHHADTFEALTRPRAIGAGILVAGGYAALLTLLWRRQQKRVVFLLAWPLITLLPVMKLGTFGDVLYADRFLYLPSVGFLMGAVLLWNKTAVKQMQHRTGRNLGAVLLLAYGGASMALCSIHTPYWKDDESLFGHAALTSPSSAYIQYNLGNSLSEAGKDATAVHAYMRAVEIEPHYGAAFANMGIALMHGGRDKDAIACLRKALSLGDNSVVTYTSLGTAYRALGDLESARQAYEASLDISETAAARSNLGECLLAQHHPAQAEAHFRRAYRIEPSPRILCNLGSALLEQDRATEAMPYLREAERTLSRTHGGDAFAVAYNLAWALKDSKGTDAAKPYAERARALLRQGHGPPAADGQTPDILESILGAMD
ncbi:MAG: tetratricopeptide repeat protein [Lentisphaerae bacterium]|nr:tetratricopeptide repeat protein [Lentisphaerota bacterium]